MISFVQVLQVVSPFLLDPGELFVTCALLMKLAELEPLCVVDAVQMPVSTYDAVQMLVSTYENSRPMF